VVESGPVRAGLSSLGSVLVARRGVDVDASEGGGRPVGVGPADVTDVQRCAEGVEYGCELVGGAVEPDAHGDVSLVAVVED
jgi:hypothetical protein